MFSIVIPLYNKEQSIGNTLQSVLNQTFTDFEIIIVDDGSTDKSAQVVESYKESYKNSNIKLIQQNNKGVSAARNRGINEAKYSWIALLDGDDIWEPHHLSVVASMIKAYPSYFVFTTSFIYSNDSSFNQTNNNQKNTVYPIKNYFYRAQSEQLTWTSCIVINKACFSKVGLFNEQLSRGEDLDLWSRLAQSFTFVKSSNITAIYNIVAENRSDNYLDVDKIHVYHMDLNEYKDINELNYHKYQILHYLYIYLRRNDISKFLKLFNAHPSIHIYDVIMYSYSIVKSKTIRKIKNLYNQR